MELKRHYTPPLRSFPSNSQQGAGHPNLCMCLRAPVHGFTVQSSEHRADRCMCTARKERKERKDFEALVRLLHTFRARVDVCMCVVREVPKRHGEVHALRGKGRACNRGPPIFTHFSPGEGTFLLMPLAQNLENQSISDCTVQERRRNTRPDQPLNLCA
jgi:hypothetical protein